MSFTCDPATVARLEWNRLAECLAGCAATTRGQEACRGELFQPTRAAAQERLAETAEARGLLEAGEPLSFGGVSDLRATLEALERGRLAGGGELAAVAATLSASGRLRRFLHERRARAPLLADLAGTLPDLGRLAAQIGEVVDESGEVRADASPALAKLRRRIRELQAEIDRRMSACLRNPSFQPCLQDDYITTREGRPVLPVRTDARSRVNGIVHDISSSGTTVFVEPEAVVELGNRLRMATTELEREIERLLRELGARVNAESSAISATGATLEALDLAWARARLARRLESAAPEIAEDGELELRALRHPLLLLETQLSPEQVVANDVRLQPGVRGLVISGPNAGGKTVAAKAIGLAALALRAGLEVPCAGGRMRLFDSVHADIGDEQDLRAGLSTFSARMANLARIVERADSGTLVIVDEVGEGTEPGEGAALAQALLEALVERGATVVATTHFNRLKELAGHDPRFENASAEFDPDTLQPTYRITMGVPGSSGATWVAERMGVPEAVVQRAQALLDSEDRKLEELTRSLSELRGQLESERREAALGRERSESARATYEARLNELQGAREEVLASMKSELEGAFKSARDELGAVMRSVQSRDRADSEAGRAANVAYEELAAIEERTAEVESAHAPSSGPRQIVDWKHVAPGARLELEGIRGEAVLVEPPDHRGRVVVRVGDARTELPARRVVRVLEATTALPPRPQPPRVERTPEPEELLPECDLRGMRVDEALDRAEAHLHELLGRGIDRVCFIHGHGTGALRTAIRTWLQRAPGVSSFAPGAEHEGGNGVTIASLEH